MATATYPTLTNAGPPKFCKYIVRNGKVIYHKKAKVFGIPLSNFKKPKS